MPFSSGGLTFGGGNLATAPKIQRCGDATSHYPGFLRPTQCTLPVARSPKGAPTEPKRPSHRANIRGEQFLVPDGPSKVRACQISDSLALQFTERVTPLQIMKHKVLVGVASE